MLPTKILKAKHERHSLKWPALAFLAVFDRRSTLARIDWRNRTMSTPSKPVNRRDATGHLNPEYERKLRETSLENKTRDDDKAFLGPAAASDELAEELGESFIQAATSGEDAEGDRHEAILEEETGGPFVPSTAGQEFAGGTDESNIPEATREALPRTSKAEV
jgi:hypothetical protein